MLEALFLDRDGVLNEDRPDSVRSWEEFRFLPGALAALALLRRAGIRVAVVTNQAVVGRGHLDRAEAERIHERMGAEVAAHGGAIERVFACFHAPEDRCSCRKPEPGLLLEAASELGVALARTAFVGDDVRDLLAAERAGAIPVLVLTGKGASTWERVKGGEARARAVFADLEAVARAVLHGEL